MSVTPKSKVLGLRSRMGKSRRELMKENNDSAHSVSTESSGKTGLSEGSEQNEIDSKNNNSSCMVTPVKTKSHTEMESPDVPQSSRFIQSLLPKMFGSPEIDVSWDWSSSQIPTDSGNISVDSFVPKIKHIRTRSLNRRVPRVLPPEIIFRPRLPPDKCISEEEQKKRVEFYRNLYNEIKGNTLEAESSVSESALNNESSEAEMCVEIQNEKYEALFDDSNNEIMLECSQAIEEVYQVKDESVSNLAEPPSASVSEEPPSVVNSHSPDITNDKSVFRVVLENRSNKSLSDSQKTNSELRTPLASKLGGRHCQGRTRTLQNKTDFKHSKQSFTDSLDNDLRVSEHQMDVTTLFDDNDDEFSSLAVDMVGSIPGSSNNASNLETKRCSQFEIEEKRKQALKKLMKKKGISKK